MINMEITLTWHLLIVIILSILLIIGVFKEEEGLDFTSVFCLICLLILWAIYGGIFIW